MSKRNRVGSVVIVGMILGLTLATMAGGYIALTSQSMKQSQRAFYMNAAFNLAESGAEHAVWCLKNTWTMPSADWTPGQATKQFKGKKTSPTFTDAQGAVGYFNVRVTQANTITPTIIAEGVVIPKVGGPVTRQVRVKLKTNSLFGAGLIGQGRMEINGGNIDSYRSSVGTPLVAPREFDVMVGSTSTTSGDFTTGSGADIYGYVSVGLGSNSINDLLSNMKGELRGPTTAAGEPGVVNNSGKLVDTNRIAYNFNPEFPDVSIPAPNAGTLVLTTLPPANAQGVILVGDPTGLVKTRYRVPSMSVSTSQTLMIAGPVEFEVATHMNVAGAVVVMTGPTSVNTIVANKIVATTTYVGRGSANVWVNGDITIGGSGAFNADNKPAAMQIYGTVSKAEYAAGARQTISIGGNGNLCAAVYSPNGHLALSGGGSTGYFAGASIGRTVRIVGSGYRVRYDKDLENVGDPAQFKVDDWVELYDATDRFDFAG